MGILTATWETGPSPPFYDGEVCPQAHSESLAERSGETGLAPEYKYMTSFLTVCAGCSCHQPTGPEAEGVDRGGLWAAHSPATKAEESCLLQHAHPWGVRLYPTLIPSPANSGNHGRMHWPLSHCWQALHLGHTVMLTRNPV